MGAARAVREARGHFPDEMEYFAAKNLAIDGPMSIQGVNVASRPWNARMEEQFTILGWYERLRLARYFDEPTLQRWASRAGSSGCGSNAAGQWQFTPVHLAKHRISALGNGSEHWTIENPFAAQPLRVRLEALYCRGALRRRAGRRARRLRRSRRAEQPQQRGRRDRQAGAGNRGRQGRRAQPAAPRGQHRRQCARRLGANRHELRAPYFSMLPGEAWACGSKATAAARC